MAYATRFQRASRVNLLLTMGGAVLGFAGLVGPRPAYGLSAVGAGMVVASFPFQARADRSLNRAVWWYNAALPNTPVPSHD